MADTVDFDNSVDPVTDENFPNIGAPEPATDEPPAHTEDLEPQQADAPEPADD